MQWLLHRLGHSSRARRELGVTPGFSSRGAHLLDSLAHDVVRIPPLTSLNADGHPC